MGKLAREYLVTTRKWEALRPRVADTGNVTEAANAAKVGSADAAIVWDAVAAAAAYKGQSVLAVAELEGVNGRIELAVLKQSRDPDSALKFAHYVTASDHGLLRFREFGFRVVGDAGGFLRGTSREDVTRVFPPPPPASV